MDSEFNNNLSLETESTESGYSIINWNQWCGWCRERLWEIEDLYFNFLRHHNNNNECPFCNSDTLSIGDNSSLITNDSADTDDSDSTEYRNLCLGLTDELEFSLQEDLSESSGQAYFEDFASTSSYSPAEQGELDEFLLGTPPYMPDEPQAEESEIHQYPVRSTRSDISSYYETPLHNRFWTRRRSSSRSRHVS